jgi:hypothetical protein
MFGHDPECVALGAVVLPVEPELGMVAPVEPVEPLEPVVAALAIAAPPPAMSPAVANVAIAAFIGRMFDPFVRPT